VFRLLLLIGLGYLVYQLFSPKTARKNRNGAVPSGSAARSSGATGEKMVKCAVCGTYVPEHEALRGGPRNAQLFCSKQCRAGGRG